MKQTFYYKNEGGIAFRSNRRPGDTRVPNYVYDIWMPLLGIDTIGVYSVYCRLEMQGTVKRITLADLSRACRIGKSTLRQINSILEEAGFLKVTRPEGQKRLLHWTTEITIYDPPATVPNELIEKYAHPQGYETLTPWLEGDTPTDTTEYPDRYSDETEQVLDEGLDKPSNIESLDLNPLSIEAPDSQKEKRDYLSDVMGMQGKVSELTAEYPEDQFWTYRDGFLQIFQSRLERSANQTEKDEIIKLAAEKGASLDTWDKSFRESILNWGGNGKPPLARVIEVYRCDGDYEKWRKQKYAPGNTPADDTQGVPEKIELRDAATGELIETRTIRQ